MTTEEYLETLIRETTTRNAYEVALNAYEAAVAATRAAISNGPDYVAAKAAHKTATAAKAACKTAEANFITARNASHAMLETVKAECDAGIATRTVANNKGDA